MDGMTVKVRIPTPLRSLTGGRSEIFARGDTVAVLIETLDQEHPGLKARLFETEGQLRRFINIYVNDEDIRFHQGVATPVKAGDEISIVPAIAGG